MIYYVLCAIADFFATYLFQQFCVSLKVVKYKRLSVLSVIDFS